MNFKKCFIWLSNFGVLCIALESRNKKKLARIEKPEWYPISIAKGKLFPWNNDYHLILQIFCPLSVTYMFFDSHISVAFWESARRSGGKTHSGITKAVPLKKLGSHFWLLSKSASKDTVTLTFLTFMHFFWHITVMLLFYFQIGFTLYIFSCYGPTKI